MAGPSTDALIRVEVREKIMAIEINRPAKKNALTEEMYLSLTRSLASAQADGGVHVILLYGAGDCFSSGNDLKDFLKLKEAGSTRPGLLFLETISTVAKPIVAAVNGPAVGIGTTMLLHCDLVYAGASATFQVPFVNLGLCPEGGSSLLLPRVIGYPRAAEMLLLGEPISAHMAWEYGLINNVYPDDELTERVFKHARQLARQPSDAMYLTKRLLKESCARSIADTIATESRHFSQRLASREFKDACALFFERRQS